MATQTEVLERNEVDLTNIGPIDHLRLPIRPGSITVLTGANGAGKTQALDAVDALTRGKNRLQSKDGTVNGKAVGFGVRIKVGRGGANRRTELGEELQVESIEDRLSIAELVDPKLKDPCAADARRIKALVALSEQDADKALFYDIFNGDQALFDMIVSPDSCDKDDLVAMAAAIKRDVERASRAKADQAETARRDANAKREANEGIDTAGPADGPALQTELEHSIERRAELIERRTKGLDLLKDAEEARAQLEAAEGDRIAIPGAIDDIRTACVDAEASATFAADRVSNLEAELKEARADQRVAESNRDAAHERLLSAERHSATCEAWRATIDNAEGLDVPSTADIEAADQAVKNARESVEQGVRIRDARKRIVEADAEEQRARDLEVEADSLRDSAKATEDVLTRIVAGMGGPFRVDEDFRLVVKHPARGECYFAELSEGERWRLGLDAAIESFQRRGDRGLCVVPQHAWEALDGRNRRLIADHIAGTDLAVLTAAASQDEDPAAEVAVSVYGE